MKHKWPCHSQLHITSWSWLQPPTLQISEPNLAWVNAFLVSKRPNFSSASSSRDSLTPASRAVINRVCNSSTDTSPNNAAPKAAAAVSSWDSEWLKSIEIRCDNCGRGSSFPFPVRLQAPLTFLQRLSVHTSRVGCSQCNPHGTGTMRGISASQRFPCENLKSWWKPRIGNMQNESTVNELLSGIGKWLVMCNSSFTDGTWGVSASCFFAGGSASVSSTSGGSVGTEASASGVTSGGSSWGFSSSLGGSASGKCSSILSKKGCLFWCHWKRMKKREKEGGRGTEREREG